MTDTTEQSSERRGRRPASVGARLPSGRATIGAVLIAIAAGGVFVAHRSASAPPQTRYLVATRSVDVGTVLSASDLGSIALDLPAEVGAIRESDAQRLVGRTVRSPLDELDLLRATDLAEPGRFSSPDAVEISVELSPARALSGALRVGDLVDVLATDPSGAGTTTIARGVAVVDLGSNDADGIGRSSGSRVRLSLDGPEQAELVVDAAVRAELTLALPTPTVERGT